MEELRKHWAVVLVVTLQSQFLLDTKPVPVVGYKRSKRHSDFAGSAEYGVCVGRSMKYFGYKLVLVSTLDGIPAVYELVPATRLGKLPYPNLLTAQNLYQWEFSFKLYILESIENSFNINNIH